MTGIDHDGEPHSIDLIMIRLRFKILSFPICLTLDCKCFKIMNLQ